jgi:hypothetical protein
MTGLMCPNATLGKNSSVSVCTTANVILQSPTKCQSNSDCPVNVTCECSPFVGESYCLERPDSSDSGILQLYEL